MHTWQSRDGLTLSARVYPGDRASTPVVCLPGLTRNSRDFEGLAAAIAPARRVICPDLRGRGRSQYSPVSATYNPAQYCDDTLLMLAAMGVDRFVAIGTSLGGIMTMLLASIAGSRIAGAVLNDIGPDIDPAGLARIRSYVGVTKSYADWDAAARALAVAQADVYPGLAHDGWLQLARRWMREDAGLVVFDYDMAIAEPILADDGTAPAPDLWPLFDALAGRPVLVVRGGASDILSRETADAMAARYQDVELLTLPGIGHAPTLDEPGSRDAVARLLGQIA